MGMRGDLRARLGSWSTTSVAVVLLVLVGSLAACSSSDDGSNRNPNRPASTIDVHAFAGTCQRLAADDGSVRLTGDGWTIGGDEEGAAPFRMQATALGNYLLYGPDGKMIAAVDDEAVSVVTEPGPAADWKLESDDASLRLTNVKTKRSLTIGEDRRLIQSKDDAAAWSLDPAKGCETFPDIDPGVDGTPFVGGSSDAPVRGYLDAHAHLTAFQFLGGEFHCGRPWSPYGVTVALKDCANHADGEVGAITEGLLSTGDLSGKHDQSGWPDFTGWPNPDSLTHEGTYWRWIERNWRGGLRLMVTHLVDNRALCEIFPANDGTECNDMASARDQARDLRALQDYIDAQFGGPGKGFFRIVTTPADARKVINDGKLAVVMGVEASEILDCGRGSGPTCDEASIDRGLDELHELGVRSVFPVHKFDNGLGGTMYDGGLTGVFVNVGNRYATGEWWDPQPCKPGETPDNTVMSPGPLLEGNAELIAELLGDKVLPLLENGVPTYTDGPHCNPKGLTELGTYVIEGLMKRGMMVETDHLSAKARSQALDLLEAADYPGVIASHTWDDPVARKRLVALDGMVAPYAGSGFVADWTATRAAHPTGDLPGIGFGSDTNGLAPQPDPREGNEKNPVRYPFKTFDGGSTVQQQVSGTRTYDVNTDGAAHYGLFVDWIEDLRITGGQELIDDLSSGAEAYLQMWAKVAAP